MEITLDQNVLTIQGEIAPVHEQENEQFHLRERHYGRFSRSVRLPAGLQTDAVEADLTNGVLTITVPKAEESKPKRITIGSGGSGRRHQIEGRFMEEKETDES